MKSLSILFFILCFLGNVQCQSFQYAVTASGGISWMSVEEEIYGGNPYSPSGKVGVMSKLKLNERWCIRGELGFLHLRSRGNVSKEKPRNIPLIILGNDGFTPVGGVTPISPTGLSFEPVAVEGVDFITIGDTYNNIEVSNYLNYISTAAAIEYKWKRVNFFTGVQAMFLSFGCGERNGRELELDMMRKNEVGSISGIEFMLSRNFGLRSDVYFGAMDLVNNEDYFVRKNRQITIGLNYYLTKKN